MRKNIILELETEYDENVNFRKEYIKLIKKHTLSEHYEKHHILPVSMFPKWKNRKTNLVKLSIEDHYRAHYLLYKIYNNYEMTAAFFFMLKTTNWKYNPQLYSEVKQKYIYYLNKSVYCYELNKDFVSISKAAESINKAITGLSNICRNKSFDKTIGGYHWCFLNNKEEAIKYWKNNLIYKNKPVYCYELNKEFNSSALVAKEILSYLKQSDTHISENCRSKSFTKTVGGYHWCYAIDKEEAINYWKNNILPVGKNKPVYCYELNKDFLSAKYATFEVNGNAQDITNKCKNKQYDKTVNNYHWCYLENKEEAINYWKNNLIYKNKSVYCFELNKEYTSINEASKYLGTYYKINKICNSLDFEQTINNYHICFTKDKEKLIDFISKKG